MCTHKADEDVSYCEFHYHYQAIFVASNVKYIMLVADIVGSRKIHSDVRQTSPIRLLRYVIPAF